MASEDGRTKTSHDQSKKISETTHENQSSNQSFQSWSKRSFFPFNGISVQSNFRPCSSTKSLSAPRSYAQPFDEFDTEPLGTDASSVTTHKPGESDASSAKTKA